MFRFFGIFSTSFFALLAFQHTHTQTHPSITTENSCYAFVNSAPKFFCILLAFVTTSQNVKQERQWEKGKKVPCRFYLCDSLSKLARLCDSHAYIHACSAIWRHYVCKSSERDEFTECDMNEHIKMDTQSTNGKKGVRQQAVTRIFPSHLTWAFRIFLLEKSNSHYRFHLSDWPWQRNPVKCSQLSATQQFDSVFFALLRFITQATLRTNRNYWRKCLTRNFNFAWKSPQSCPSKLFLCQSLLLSSNSRAPPSPA